MPYSRVLEFSLMDPYFPEEFDLQVMELEVEGFPTRLFISMDSLRGAAQSIDPHFSGQLLDIASEYLPETTDEVLNRLRQLPVPTDIGGASFWTCDACSAEMPPHGAVKFNGEVLTDKVFHLMQGIDLLYHLEHQGGALLSPHIAGGLFLQMLAAGLPPDIMALKQMVAGSDVAPGKETLQN